MSFREDFQSVQSDLLGPEGLGKEAFLEDGTKIDIIEIYNYDPATGFENTVESGSLRICAKTSDAAHLVHGDKITIETESELIEDMIDAETYKIDSIEPGGMGRTILILSKN